MKRTLLIVTAPPASGKTYWIQSYGKAIGPSSLLVVSPLRALANECISKWKNEIKIVTPEEWKREPVSKDVVIFDEFHLNFYWGDTFRPVLWEAFYALASEARLCILLTATLSTQMLHEIEKFECHFDEINWCNFGNQCLKNLPASYFKLPSKKWMSELIENQRAGEGTGLIFCQYRNEVREWKEKLEKLGFSVWDCVGGESQSMRLKMESGPPPDFIVATTVLSHGVNLPSISHIFFLYSLKNPDFWIQMVARGGRRGGPYKVYALENPHGIKWSKWTNFLAILCLGFKIKLHVIIKQADQWFLKESS